MMRNIIVLLLSVAAVFSSAAQSRSEWLINLRESGKYIYDDGKAVRSSAEPFGDGFVWLIESAGGPEVRICNKLTGRYIHLSQSGGVEMSALTGPEDKTFWWRYGGFNFSSKENAGWYTVHSPMAADGTLLCMRDGALDYREADRLRDYSAHWTFQRVGSDSVPYVLDYDSVRESSFLGERVARAVNPSRIESDYHGPSSWELTKDISAFPQFSSSGNLMVQALYNMALEEMLLDIRPSDGTFCAGALWPDTWTRDAVYSIWFAYSWIMPEVSRKTLEKQTLKNPSEALQDTGTGGSYPISTDRVVWAVAAWEYYLATGDVDWLKEAYEGLSYTARKDLHVAYDPEVRLFRGETCSMDWRKHTYPNWFTNAVIGESYSSGTNCLHYFLYDFLSEASRVLKAPVEDRELWSRVKSDLRQGINEAFWSEEKGLYDVWLYPEFIGYLPSGRVGAMSNGLAAAFGVASDERRQRILDNYPMYAYGASVLYPSKPEGYSYHNKSVWPVWQTPLLFAAKNAGDSDVAEFLARTIIRSGALFLSHKENMTYDTGYDGNTALNSPRQLWSVASYLSMVYRVLFGISMSQDGMAVTPMLPEWMGGSIELTGFRYRNATVNINVKGSGTVVSSLKVNGRKKNPATFSIPAGARGVYNLELVMSENGVKHPVNVVMAGPGECWSPVEPVIRLENSHIFWSVTPGCTYTLKGKGVSVGNIHSPYDVSSLPAGFYSVCAVADNGVESDLSNPVLLTKDEREYEIGVKDFRESHTDVEVEFDAPADGDYVIWFEGTNGRGPHDVYCTIRSLFLDQKDFATIFLEAYGDWNEVTLTNHVILRDLKKGRHILTVKLNPEGKGYDNNMSFNTRNLNDWEIRRLVVTEL